MEIIKSMHIALLGAFLLAASTASVWAQSAPHTRDQDQTVTGTAKKDKKNAQMHASASQSGSDSGAASSKKKSTPKQADAGDKSATAASGSAPASKTSTRQAPPANSAGMVWVNTDSGIYHKPGTHWYGKTKQGKYKKRTPSRRATTQQRESKNSFPRANDARELESLRVFFFVRYFATRG